MVEGREKEEGERERERERETDRERERQTERESNYFIILQRLESGVPLGSLADITSVVELLQESSQWFPGGSKEMKVRTCMYTFFLILSMLYTLICISFYVENAIYRISCVKLYHVL